MIKRPRIENPKHLAWIRTLPCVICYDNVSVEAAHVRCGDMRYYKPYSGIGEKPSDMWTVPLCGNHHREQHSMNEAQWWWKQNIDPFRVALALFINTGDPNAAHVILERARN